MLVFFTYLRLVYNTSPTQSNKTTVTAPNKYKMKHHNIQYFNKILLTPNKTLHKLTIYIIYITQYRLFRLKFTVNVFLLVAC